MIKVSKLIIGASALFIGTALVPFFKGVLEGVQQYKHEISMGIYGPTDLALRGCLTEEINHNTNINSGDPKLSDEAILSWAKGAAKDIMTFDYHNTQAQIKSKRRYFTSKGFCDFQVALSKANIIEAVINKQFTATLEPTGQAQLINKGLEDSVYQWLIEIPVSISFTNGKEKIFSNIINETLLLKIIRTDDPVNFDEIGIVQWNTIN